MLYNYETVCYNTKARYVRIPFPVCGECPVWGHTDSLSGFEEIKKRGVCYVGTGKDRNHAEVRHSRG